MLMEAGVLEVKRSRNKIIIYLMDLKQKDNICEAFTVAEHAVIMAFWSVLIHKKLTLN